MSREPENLTEYRGGGVTIIQPQPYLEDGWFIEVMDSPDYPVYSVYWIPKNGGQEQHLKDFKDREAALDYAKDLA